LGLIGIRIETRPTSLHAPEEEIYGEIQSDCNARLRIDFGNIVRAWWCDVTSLAEGDGALVVCSAGETATFRATLVLEAHDGKWKPLTFYPFVSSELRSRISVRVEEGEEVSLSIVGSITLPSNMVAYWKSRDNFPGYSLTREGRKGELVYASSPTLGKGKATLDCGLVFRFRPFYSLQRAATPIAFMFASALLTLGITQAPVPFDAPAFAQFLRLSVNASLFATMGSFYTPEARSFFQLLRLTFWAFVAAIVIHVTFPSVLGALGFNLFDLFLKIGLAFLFFSVTTSLVIYPLFSSRGVREKIMFLFLVAVIGVAVLSTWLFYPLPLARELYRMSN